LVSVVRSSAQGLNAGSLALNATQATITLTSTSSTNTLIRFDDNSVQKNFIYRNGATDFRITSDAALTNGVKLADAGNAWAAISSDRRVKPDPVELDVLSWIERFRAVRYRHKLSGHMEIGAISQEMLPLMPELVLQGEDDDDREITRGDDPGMWSLIYDPHGRRRVAGRQAIAGPR
jgi:hypothetical protein